VHTLRGQDDAQNTIIVCVQPSLPVLHRTPASSVEAEAGNKDSLLTRCLELRSVLSLVSGSKRQVSEVMTLEE